ncbi:laccase [Russula compacta]|nr:laccase [Russula compacta]
MRPIASFFLATILARVYAVAIGPSATLTITNEIVAPDGYSRGDTFSLNVFNNLDDSSLDLVTSVHWHGIFQVDTNYADGGAFVSQCPIVPGESFLYQFNAGEQTGTYWYYSHYKAQYCDGLRGAFVIYDPEDPHLSLYDIDDESTVITLADWYHYSSTEAPLIPDYNSTLINGIGRYNGGPNVSLAVVNVVQYRRYRLRLVSVSCEPAYNFSIDGHEFTIIEVEGSNVQPLRVDSLEIFAGQRYSVVLEANQPVDNYWIRALPNTGNQTYDDFTNLAILRYVGAPIRDPTSDPTTNIPESPLAPTPVPGKPVRGGADININLDVVFDTTTLDFTVNNFSYASPSVPVLLQILSGVTNASDLLPQGSIYGLESNKSVEISIPGGAAGGPHPLHLHGHDFHVVRSAGNSTYNYRDPVIRDVVSIGNSTNDNVTIRFFTDNPGPWFFHCHIDSHLELGFAVVFAEDVPEVSSSVHQTDGWDALFPAYNNYIDE